MSGYTSSPGAVGCERRRRVENGGRRLRTPWTASVRFGDRRPRRAESQLPVDFPRSRPTSEHPARISTCPASTVLFAVNTLGRPRIRIRAPLDTSALRAARACQLHQCRTAPISLCGGILLSSSLALFLIDGESVVRPWPRRVAIAAVAERTGAPAPGLHWRSCFVPCPRCWPHRKPSACPNDKTTIFAIKGRVVAKPGWLMSSPAIRMWIPLSRAGGLFSISPSLKLPNQTLENH